MVLSESLLNAAPRIGSVDLICGAPLSWHRYPQFEPMDGYPTNAATAKSCNDAERTDVRDWKSSPQKSECVQRLIRGDTMQECQAKIYDSSWIPRQMVFGWRLLQADSTVAPIHVDSLN